MGRGAAEKKQVPPLRRRVRSSSGRNDKMVERKLKSPREVPEDSTRLPWLFELHLRRHESRR